MHKGCYGAFRVPRYAGWEGEVACEESDKEEWNLSLWPSMLSKTKVSLTETNWVLSYFQKMVE